MLWVAFNNLTLISLDDVVYEYGLHSSSLTIQEDRGFWLSVNRCKMIRAFILDYGTDKAIKQVMLEFRAKNVAMSVIAALDAGSVSFAF